jgi:serine/threonine-protein kinase
MGEVYKARDERLKRERRDQGAACGPSRPIRDGCGASRQEAEAAGVLNHPNLTAVYDVGTHEGAPYVVQELLEGETLRRRSPAGGFRAQAIDYALQIAHGLAGGA